MAIRWMPATPLIFRSLWICSTQMRMPSSALSSAAAMRSISSSGTVRPATLSRMYFAMPRDFRGVTPARIFTFLCSFLSRTPCIHRSKRSMS